MVIKEEEIVVSTNGRSFWILDNLNLVRQISKLADSKSNYLFKPADTYRITPPMGSDGSTGMDLGSGKIYNLGIGTTGTFYETQNKDGSKHRKMLDSGENPVTGVVINYLLDITSNEDLTINILDSNKKSIVSFSSKNANATNSQNLRPQNGMNQFIWDMRYSGPIARIPTTQSDFEQQFKLLRDIGEAITKTHSSVNLIREIKTQINYWKTNLPNSGDHKKVLSQVESTTKALLEIESNLVQIGISRPGTDRWLDRWNVPGKISDKLTELIAVVASADSKPTKQAVEVFSGLSINLERQLENFERVKKTNIEPLNQLIRELNIDPIPLSQ